MPTREFATRPFRLRLFVGLVVPLGVLAPVVLTMWVGVSHNDDSALTDLLTTLALIAGSVLGIEIGRYLEGGTVHQQRPHKALSAWPMAAVFLVPPAYLVPIVAVSYTHARWRGVRVTGWKWLASAAFLMLAGTVAAVMVNAGTLTTGAPGWPTLGSGPPGLLLTVAAVLAFLVTESALLGATALLNTAQDDAWLRRTLATRSFYLNELGVLVTGALVGLLGDTAPWFVLLLIPAFAFLQQSVLNRPLRDQASRDPKTGLLHFAAWHSMAGEEVRRLGAAGRSWAVLFADIDNFRHYNQRHGHLGGDDALSLVARIITDHVRPQDLVARFGGEEFCVLLPDTAPTAAELVAERLRVAISGHNGGLPEPVTVSIGVATVQPGTTRAELDDALAVADRALYQAKLEGRNTVRMHLPKPMQSPVPGS